MGKFKGAMFRIGVMGMISQFEILSTIGALESTLADLGLKFEYGAGSKAARDVFARQS
jgi:aspartate aminotransferase-like enzyme